MYIYPVKENFRYKLSRIIMTAPPYIKYLILSFVIALCLASCKESGEVKLELTNKQIFYTDIDPTGGEYSDESLKKSQNILNYTLTNTTGKKLLFVFEPQELSSSIGISPTTQYYGYIGFTITDKNDSIKQVRLHLPLWTEMSDLFECDLYLLQKKREKYVKLGVKPQHIEIVDKFINHSIVVYPGETRTFQAVLHLPIVQQTDRRLQHGGSYYPKLDKDDTLKLFYYCKAKELKNSLPVYLQEELVKNGIEIFDGELSANPVKLAER